MNQKTILLTCAENLVANCHVRELEEAGFKVQLAANAESALAAVMNRPPDALVLDLIQPGMAAVEFIRTIRSTSAVQTVPIFTLPTVHAELTREAGKAGATWMLPRGTNQVAEMIDAIQSMLRLPRTATARKNEPPKAAAADWLKVVAAREQEHLSEIRENLHFLVKRTQDRHSLRGILLHYHAVTELLALHGAGPLHAFAGAVEMLAHSLCTTPSRLNSSTLHTIGDGTDFLSQLIILGPRAKLRLPDGSRILAADDEADSREIIVAALGEVGLKPTAVATPIEALDALRASPYDLVFLDIEMPGMSGFELCERIRSTPAGAKVPIVFITGHDEFSNRAKSSLLGANGIVGKPFSVAELGVTAMKWLLKGQLAASAQPAGQATSTVG